MNKLQEALDRLDNGNQWTKGSSFKDDRQCLLGAIGNATDSYYLNWASKDAATIAAVSAVADIIRSQFPDRLYGDEVLQLSACRAFNDNAKTTWDDVRSVLEKAAVELDV